MPARFPENPADEQGRAELGNIGAQPAWTQKQTRNQRLRVVRFTFFPGSSIVFPRAIGSREQLLKPISPHRSSKESVHFIHLLPNGHAGDEQDQQSRRSTQDAHVRGHSLHPKLKLFLFHAEVGTGFVQKELIVLV
jgi:hypothetical protein